MNMTKSVLYDKLGEERAKHSERLYVAYIAQIMVSLLE